MLYKAPIYTEKTQCQDCYKCVRHCPVKAIRVANNSASVIDEMCVSCGKCLRTCPVQAKKVRFDLDLARFLIKRKERVYASIAPAFVSEYGAENVEKLVGALKRLGFAGVSETAIGAHIVSQNVDEHLKKNRGISISSACPAAVELVQKYYPHLVPNITPLDSPLLTHCQFLKDKYGDDIGIIFIGPCVAKKNEADSRPDLLDVVLTFDDLNQWLFEDNIDLDDVEKGELVPQRAGLPSVYPLDGGMIKTLSKRNKSSHSFMSFSGISGVRLALDDLENFDEDHSVFLELLTCTSGCVNGPASISKRSVIKKNRDIVKHSFDGDCSNVKSFSIDKSYTPIEVPRPDFSEQDIRSALDNIGKREISSELNCGGCGYNSCRSFAEAILMGHAEPSMCVSYMRKLASNKANALLQAIPSGVVLVNDEMIIQECNKRFAEMMGDDALSIYELSNTLCGADLKRIFPHHKYFTNVLQSHGKIDKRIKIGGSILQLSLFLIDSNLVGGIVQDVTAPSMRREQIVKNTQEVIRKNLQTVQRIAYLLGENAAESEVILNSVIDSFQISDEDQGE